MAEQPSQSPENTPRPVSLRDNTPAQLPSAPQPAASSGSTVTAFAIGIAITAVVMLILFSALNSNDSDTLSKDDVNDIVAASLATQDALQPVEIAPVSEPLDVDTVQAMIDSAVDSAVGTQVAEQAAEIASSAPDADTMQSMVDDAVNSAVGTQVAEQAPDVAAIQQMIDTTVAAQIALLSVELASNDGTVDIDAVQQMVDAAVTAQVAQQLAEQPSSVDMDTIQQMIDAAINNQLAQQPGESDTVDADAVQDMVDAAVGTQVAMLKPTATPLPPTATPLPAGAAEDDDAFLGPDDAPVVIVEFSDFQCGYCGRWYQTTLPEILAAYPTEVKFVYRDFPIFGEDSLRASLATECAEEQSEDAFWGMHNRLFTRLTQQEDIDLSEESLIMFADELGLDTDSFTECLTSQKYYDEVLNDYRAATEYGMGGTPGFVINDQVYAIGAQSFEVFSGIIEAELEKANSQG